MNVMLKRFEDPDETRVFPNGKFEVVRVGGMTIGRACETHESTHGLDVHDWQGGNSDQIYAFDSCIGKMYLTCRKDSDGS